MQKYNWKRNAFYQDIRRRVRFLWRHVHTGDMVWDKRRMAWKQTAKRGKCSVPVFLQNRFMCWDVTDHGIGICPMLTDTRSYFGISAIVHDSGDNVDLRDLLDMESAHTYVYPGKVETVFTFGKNTVSFCITMPYLNEAACISIDARLSHPNAWFEPYVMSYAEDISSLPYGIALTLKHFPILDETVSRNNSVTADPPRKSNGEKSRLVVMLDGAQYPGVKSFPIKSTKQVLLCDRILSAKGLYGISLGRYASGLYTLKVAQQSAKSMTKLTSDASQDYWKNILEKTSLQSGIPALDRQFSYSIHNSLFSRTVSDRDATLFIHGRPDRGYGDCSKLHQSYQMYYPALLAGEYDSVKTELRAYTSWMIAEGSFSFQLRVGGGTHHYDGLYSNAHYVMGIYRYLCFSGDFAFLEEKVKNHVTHEPLIVLDAMLAACSWLEKRKTPEGVMQPCGWLDAWPPSVVAQAQVSFSALLAYQNLAELLTHIGHGKAEYWRQAADALRAKIKEVFYYQDNGLYAEHLFQDGSVRGADTMDFWAHTQIWSHLSGANHDRRGLMLCLQYCVEQGTRVIPYSGIHTDYIAKSTDGLSDLSSGSTATWLLANWPELNNLLSMVLAKAGKPEVAYALFSAAMPETLYREFGDVAPFYYSEKYLYPYHCPWLCTWAGDPTFIEALVSGFLGLRVSMEGYIMEPNLPSRLLQQPIVLKFIWRGEQRCIRIGDMPMGKHKS